ncbi:MAG: DUF370 domain-containing protein [Oscillospiraceae bacterium]|nr:DUF370 domain-containing protein [Oscillospiraceae bacterium]MDD7353665.1 DUF370 domain-containing protein [Oscillospiraceae bacterium]MDY3938643.1 DUF370 domain-containing protein [Oscillospiraceae bacterium]
MYLHLGQSTVIKTNTIIGIFDLDNTTVMKSTREYLNKAQKDGDVINVSDELPKSFTVTEDKKNGRKVYIAQPAVSTLIKRLANKDF